MKTTVKLIALFATLTLASCNANLNLGDGVDGSGNVATEKRTIEALFTKIEASTGVEVIVEQGTPTEVEVEVDDNLMEYIITKVENGTLIVKIEGNINTMESAIIRVKTSIINGLESTSGATIRSKNTLRGTELTVKSSSGSEIHTDVEYEKVSCESTSGSEIKVSGKALALETKSSSGSDIEAQDLAANEIYAQSTSGSSTTVSPIVLLNAKASSAASITSNCKPRDLRGEETSGGTVSVQ